MNEKEENVRPAGHDHSKTEHSTCHILRGAGPIIQPKQPGFQGLRRKKSPGTYGGREGSSVWSLREQCLKVCSDQDLWAGGGLGSGWYETPKKFWLRRSVQQQEKGPNLAMRLWASPSGGLYAASRTLYHLFHTDPDICEPLSCLSQNAVTICLGVVQTASENAES